MSGWTNLPRRGTLHGNQGVAGAAVDSDRITNPLDVLANPGEVLRDVRRVHDEQEVIGGQAVHEQVVDERPVRHHEARVLRLADAQPGRVVARDPLNRCERVGAGDLDLAHVADVEQPRARSHGQVLVGDAGVLHRHVPAGKRHHPGAERDVPSVQSSFLDC